MDKFHSFSVIIPSYNAARTISKILENLTNSDYPPELMEIIVAYDRSTDNTREIIQKYNVKISESDQRSGPSGGRNRGAKTAKNDYLIFLDSDVIPNRNTIRQFNSAINQHPGFDIIQAVYADASYKSVFSQYQQSWFSYFYCLRKNYETNILSSSAICIKRDIFLALGGFKQRKKKPAVEDIELGYRLLRASKKILICTDVQVFHDTHHSLISFIKRNFDVHNFMLTKLSYRQNDIRMKNPEYDIPIKNIYLSFLIFVVALALLLSGYLLLLLLLLLAASSQIWLNRGFFQHLATRRRGLKLIPMYLILQLDSLVKVAGLLFGVYEYYFTKQRITPAWE